MNCSCNLDKDSLLHATAESFKSSQDMLLLLELNLRTIIDLADSTNRDQYACWALLNLMTMADLVSHDTETQNYSLTQFGKNVLNLMDQPIKFRFKSLDSYKITGRGEAYVVKNPLLCNDFFWLINETVRIDGLKYKVTGVEVPAINADFRAGINISLLAHKVN